MANWHKDKWKDKAAVVANDTTEALQLVYDSLNKGQQQKLMKNETVKTLFDRYGVVTDVPA